MKRSIIGYLASHVSGAAPWIAVASLATVVACTQQPGTFVLNPGDDDGDGTTDGGDGDDSSTGTGAPQGSAKADFIAKVYPALSVVYAGATDSCVGCHSDAATGAPVFLADSAEAAYNAIVGYSPTLIAIPDNSNLIHHGVHTGPALSAPDSAIVSDWLMKEATERGLAGGGGDNPPPVGKTLNQAFDEFANCMDMADWEMYMSNLASQDTANAGECNSCHNTGMAAAYLSLNVTDTYEHNKMQPYIRRLVTGTVDAQGNFADLVPSRRFENKGLEAASCDQQTQNCHPVYNLTPARKEGVDMFVQTTLDKWHNDQCPTTPSP